MATGRMQYLGDVPSSADDLADKGYVDSQTSDKVSGENGAKKMWLGTNAELPSTGQTGTIYFTTD